MIECVHLTEPGRTVIVCATRLMRRPILSCILDLGATNFRVVIECEFCLNTNWFWTNRAYNLQVIMILDTLPWMPLIMENLLTLQLPW